MRPYTGIGVAVFSRMDNHENMDLQLKLYEEPGLSRVGIMNSSRFSGNEWVFGLQENRPPLVVSARKGDWLQVFYDNAGRKAWVKPENNARFQTWEEFLKLHMSRVLPGLQSHFYQLREQPDGKILLAVAPNQPLKVLKLENDWVMALTAQSQIGWLRWRDVDGRLTIGTGNP